MYYNYQSIGQNESLDVLDHEHPMDHVNNIITVSCSIVLGVLQYSIYSHHIIVTIIILSYCASYKQNFHINSFAVQSNLHRFNDNNYAGL